MSRLKKKYFKGNNSGKPEYKTAKNQTAGRWLPDAQYKHEEGTAVLSTLWG